MLETTVGNRPIDRDSRCEYFREWSSPYPHCFHPEGTTFCQVVELEPDKCPGFKEKECEY